MRCRGTGEDGGSQNIAKHVSAPPHFFERQTHFD